MESMYAYDKQKVASKLFSDTGINSKEITFKEFVRLIKKQEQDRINQQMAKKPEFKQTNDIPLEETPYKLEIDTVV